MRQIAYDGRKFLTTDVTAVALLEFVELFTEGHSSHMVDIPSFACDGTETLVQMTVGPFSELMSVPEFAAWDELDIQEAVATHRDQSLATEALPVPRAVALSWIAPGDEVYWNDVDY